jgi:hypothetical protein
MRATHLITSTALVVAVVTITIACGRQQTQAREAEPPPLEAVETRPWKEWTVASCPDLVFASREPSRSGCRWSEEEPGTLEIWISAGARIRTTGAWPARIRLLIHSTGDAVRVKAAGRDCGWGRAETAEMRRECAPELEMLELRPGPNDHGLEWDVMVAAPDLDASAAIETEWIIYWVRAAPQRSRNQPVIA